MTRPPLPYSAELAIRLLRGGRGTILGTSATVAAGGMALGVAALVVAMGLMSGYRRDLADALVAVNAEILVHDARGLPLEEADAALASVRAVAGVGGAAAVALAPAFAVSPTEELGSAVLLKGIEPSEGIPASLARRAPQLLAALGAASADLPPAALGDELARRLSLSVGDPFRVVVPDHRSDPPRPRSASFRVAGIFTTGFAQYDRGWVFVPRAAALRALRIASPTALEVRLAPGADVGAVRERLEAILPASLRVVDWRSLNRPLFAALALQQRALFVALALIVGVAAWNLASSLSALAAARTRDVGLLTALGATRGFVLRVFLASGALLGLAGTAAGLLLGVGLCALATATRVIRFPPAIAEIYFVRWIPFRPEADDLAAVAATALLLALVASVGPARRAARAEPAASLRYE